MTAPDLGPCVCELIPTTNDPDDKFAEYHEHSDFEPHPCAEPGCGCTAHRHLRTDTEAAENQPQEPAGAPNRSSVTIPAGALDFSRQRIADAAAHLDDILTHHDVPADPDDPLAVCGLADLLEQTWPENIDPFDVLALAARRLIDATKRIPRRRIARGWGRR